LKGKALFIINPISGGKKKDGVPDLIHKHLDQQSLQPVIVFSDSVSHARQIAMDAVDQFEVVVAVGGDGTVNEVASGIVNTNMRLGIVPFGSGNGLSRFLKVPMDPEKAIKTLTEGKVEVIDSATLNGRPFFNMAGIGFDAHIAELFSHDKKRGFITYIRTTFKEFNKYKPQVYEIEIDGKAYRREAFMISFANSSQYGNNAHVSPHASVQDGMLDVCIIKRFPLWRLVEMGIRMMTKTADKVQFLEIIRGKHIVIKRTEEGPVHLDGEPTMDGKHITINVLPASLKVIVGADYKKS
jgi:YegS/Rv2252/BmrU family lipid kinase